MIHNRNRSRLVVAVITAVALAMAACTDDSPPPPDVVMDSATPAPPQVSPPAEGCRPKPPIGNPALNGLPVVPLATSLPIFESLSTFQLIVCIDRSVGPDWHFGRLDLGQADLVFSMNYLWSVACGPSRNPDLRRLYGFVDMQQPYAAQLATWTQQASCGSFIGTGSLEQTGPQRTYSLQIRLEKPDGTVEVRPSATYQLQFIAAGSAQCPTCRYHHWVITSVS
jgi:hypothetical protein